jgi:hypothetical protein
MAFFFFPPWYLLILYVLALSVPFVLIALLAIWLLQRRGVRLDSLQIQAVSAGCQIIGFLGYTALSTSDPLTVIKVAIMASLFTISVWAGVLWIYTRCSARSATP